MRRLTEAIFLPTARESNVFTGVCHSVHSWPHAYLVTAHSCWLLGHLLQCGRYASYWNAYLLLIFTEPGGTFDTVRKNLTENVMGKLSKRNFLNYFCPFLSLIVLSELLILSLKSVYYRLYMTQDETWT